jgi:hypothetical protein
MSYIQIEVDGKKLGLKFNQMALHLMAEYTDKNNETATAGYALFYAGLKSNAYVKREELEISFEQACDMLEKLDAETVSKVTAAFNESISFMKDLPKEEQKKRTVKKNTSKDA